MATLRGERHSLPALMATVSLRADRWVVHHLGADVSRAAIVRFAQATRPDFAVLSVTMSRCQPEAHRVRGDLGRIGIPR